MTPESAEYGFLSFVADRTVLQFSHASPNWSFAPHFGHSPLDVAIGKEHPLDRVEKLLDRFRIGQAGALELQVDVLRQLDVFRRMRGVPVVERDVKALQVARALARDFLDECFRCLAGAFRSEHDRRAVRVVGSHEMDFVSLHALESHPDVGLDVFHDVADVERPVGIGQGGGDEEPAAGHLELEPARGKRGF